MTITVPLTNEQEQRVIQLAKNRGVSPDALVQNAVNLILETGALPEGEAPASPEARERQLEELFSFFDSVGTSPNVSEEAFHRENWYR